MTIGRWVGSHPAKAASLAGWYQQTCGLLGSFVSVPLILKLLSPQEAGVWFSFQGFLAAVTLTDFGLSFVVARQVAHSLARTSEEALRESSDFVQTSTGWAGVGQIYRAAHGIFLRVNFVALLLIVLVHEAVLPFTKLAQARSVESLLTWYLLGLAALISLQMKLNQAVLDGIGRMYITKIVTGTSSLAMGIASVIALILARSLWTMSLASLAVALLQFSTLRWLLNRATQGKLRAPGVDLPRHTVRKLWSVAAPLGLVNSAAYCVTSVQVPLVGSILGPAQASPFYLAQRIGQAFAQAAMQLVQPQLPFFTRDIARDDRQTARHRLSRTVTVVTVLVVCGFAAYFLFSPVAVRWWVGPGRYVSRLVLFWTAVDYCLMCSASVWGHFVLASGRNPFVWSTLANGGLNLALLAALCSRLGLVGVPLASLCSGLCTNYWYNPFHGVRLYRKLKSK
jgi:O-antigen/teichoic acid export membrane protein